MAIWKLIGRFLTFLGKWGGKGAEIFLTKKVFVGSFTVIALFLLLIGSIQEAVEQKDPMIVVKEFGAITIGVDYEIEQATKLIVEQAYEPFFGLMWLGIALAFFNLGSLAWLYCILVYFVFKLYNPLDTSKQVRNYVMALYTVIFLQISYNFLFISKELGMTRDIFGLNVGIPMAYFLLGAILLGLGLILFTDQLLFALIPFLSIITWIFIFPEQRLPLQGMAIFLISIIPVISRLGDFLAPDKFIEMQNVTTNITAT